MRKVVLPWRALEVAEFGYGGAAESIGNCDLLRLAIKELMPLSDEERRAALAGCDPYTFREIWEELHPISACPPGHRPDPRRGHSSYSK